MADTDNTAETAEAAEAVGKQGANVVTRSLYTASYCVSYGLVFPTTLLYRVLPVPKSIRAGVANGAQAASDDVEPFKEKARETYASVAQKVGEKVEGVQDAFAQRRFLKFGSQEKAPEPA